MSQTLLTSKAKHRGPFLLSLALSGAALALACSSGSESVGFETGGSGSVAFGGNGQEHAATSGGGGGHENGLAGEAADGTAGDNPGSNAGNQQGGSGAVGTGTGGSAGTVATGTTVCTNGLDDDDDGLVDGFDPECSGPLDNDEDSFATGIPGDNRDPKWQDCFFDGNSGAGDDKCRYATGCLTGELPSTDEDCQVSESCAKFCRQLTPNGCDCFGCCSIELETGSAIDVMIGTSCSLENATDEKACPRCTKTTLCENDCGECELCAGKTIADLPASCQPTPPAPTGGSGGTGSGGASGAGGTSANAGSGGSNAPPPSYTCDEGLTACGPGLPPCGSAEYCSLGCCRVAIR